MATSTYTFILCANTTPGAPKFRVYHRKELVYSGELRFFLADHPEVSETDLFPTEGLEGSPGGESALAYAGGEWVFNSGRASKRWWAVPSDEDEQVYAFSLRDRSLGLATLEEFLVGSAVGEKPWWDRKLSSYVDADGQRYPGLADYFAKVLGPKGFTYHPRVRVVPFTPRFTLE